MKNFIRRKTNNTLKRKTILPSMYQRKQVKSLDTKSAGITTPSHEPLYKLYIIYTLTAFPGLLELDAFLHIRTCRELYYIVLSACKTMTFTCCSHTGTHTGANTHTLNINSRWVGV